MVVVELCREEKSFQNTGSWRRVVKTNIRRKKDTEETVTAAFRKAARRLRLGWFASAD